MKRCLLMLGMAVVVLAVVIGCDKSEQTVGPGNGGDEPGEPDQLVLARTFPPLLANGEDDVTVHATVVDLNGIGLSGVGVSFASSHGTIEPFATTDASGTATTILTSVASPTDLVAIVTARASGDSAGLAAPMNALVVVTSIPPTADIVEQAVRERGGHARSTGAVALQASSVDDQVGVPMIGISLSVEARPATIPADGISKSRIVATLVETTSRIPLEGEEVRFGASVGRITGHVTADETGAAIADLTASPGETISTVHVFYGKTLSAETVVAFSPLTLELDAGSLILVADGVSSTEVTALLVNEEGNPVPGARIDFSTTLGTVTSPSETDANGEGTATLVAGTATGTASVVATFSDVLQDEVEIAFVAVPTTDDLVFRIEPAVLPADGGSEAKLTAIALDAVSNPVPDGTAVTFSIVSGGGQIIRPVATTQDGIAEATYVAGRSAGMAVLQAASGDAQKSLQILLTPLDGVEISLQADPRSILADGVEITSISATVTDRFGNPVQPGTALEFTTSLGILEDATPTDAAGTASVKLRATPFVTGTARVTAILGGVQEIIDLEFVSEEAAHIEAVSVDPPAIGVQGASDHETARIVFEVQDRNGIPIDLDHSITLTYHIVVEGGQTDATVHPAAGVTNERGIAVATINAGTMSGAVEVFASSASLESRPIRVAIHGGLPDPFHFSIASQQLNVTGLVYFGIVTPVTAFVGDVHGNPVPDSTSVYFTTNFGLIGASAGTDELGRATVHHVTAEPVPQDGFVQITAQTVSRLGTDIYTSTIVLWSGETIIEILEPESLDIPNGGQQTIIYRVRDENGNPLVAGTSISVSTTVGTLSGDVDVVLPDTQDAAYTWFEVTLSDDDPEEIVEGQPVTVTVSVASPNGNASESIAGTIH